jgi:hypothetical protein
MLVFAGIHLWYRAMLDMFWSHLEIIILKLFLFQEGNIWELGQGLMLEVLMTMATSVIFVKLSKSWE